jgi:hypothetical protein
MLTSAAVLKFPILHTFRLVLLQDPRWYSQAMVRDGYVQSLVAWVDEIHDSFVRSMRDKTRDQADFDCILQHGFL